MTGQLWTIAAMAEAMSAERVGALPEGVTFFAKPFYPTTLLRETMPSRS